MGPYQLQNRGRIEEEISLVYWEMAGGCVLHHSFTPYVDE